MTNRTSKTYLTFWSLEPPYQNGRLRYHLGQLFVLERITRLLEESNRVSAIICDPSAILESRARNEDVIHHRMKIEAFLRSVGPVGLSVYSLSDKIREERTRDQKAFQAAEEAFLSSYAKIGGIIAALDFSQQALLDIKRYREPASDGPYEDSLSSALEQMDKQTGLPAKLALPTLYAFKYRAPWFEPHSLAATGAYLALHGSRCPNVAILEAKRNAYAWLVLEALAPREIGAWTASEFIDNVPSLEGNGYMRLADNAGCLFLDSSMHDVTDRVRRLPENTLNRLGNTFSAVFQGEQDALKQYLIALIQRYRCRGGKVEKLFIHSDAIDPQCADEVTLVLKGGGVKGLAIVGALTHLGPHYSLTRFVGTSAGAILAVLLAAGYKPKELGDIFMELDFRQFTTKSLFVALGNLILHGGINSTKAFEEWLETKLKAKIQKEGKILMRDLPNHALVFAAQEEHGTLCFDSRGDHQDTSAAHAVRCSMAIPLLFVPASRDGLAVYDGGALNNFPHRQFLQRFGDAPHIGVYLQPSRKKKGVLSGIPLLRRAAHLFAMWCKQDESQIVDEWREHIVVIDPAPIETTDFKAGDVEKSFLLAIGGASAIRFLADRGMATDETATKNERVCDDLRNAITRSRKT